MITECLAWYLLAGVACAELMTWADSRVARKPLDPRLYLWAVAIGPLFAVMLFPGWLMTRRRRRGPKR